MRRLVHKDERRVGLEGDQWSSLSTLRQFKLSLPTWKLTNIRDHKITEYARKRVEWELCYRAFS